MHNIPITSEFKYQDPEQQDMYLQCFLASVIITSPNGLTKMITLKFKGVNFAKEIKGSRLNGGVNREMEIDFQDSCGLQCIKQNGCLSGSFEFNENKKKFTCQLCKSHRFFGFKHFTEDHEFLYRGVKVIFFRGIKLNWNIRNWTWLCSMYRLCIFVHTVIVQTFIFNLLSKNICSIINILLQHFFRFKVSFFPSLLSKIVGWAVSVNPKYIIVFSFRVIKIL